VAGLKETSDAPLLRPYAQLLGGWTQVGGAFGKAELGAKLTPTLSVFADGGWERSTGLGVGAGLRWTPWG
jgi:hypothetical protein